MRIASSILPIVSSLLTTAIVTSHAHGQDTSSYEIKIEQLKAQPTMTTRFEASVDQLSAEYGRALGAVFTYVGSKGGQPTGPPFGRYHSFDEDGKFKVETGVPVAKTVPGNGTIEPSELPAGPAATLVYVGPYASLGNAHMALEDWAEVNGREAAGGVWEVYQVSAMDEPDPNKYQTKLFMPLKTDNASPTN